MLYSAVTRHFSWSGVLILWMAQRWWSRSLELLLDVTLWPPLFPPWNRPCHGRQLVPLTTCLAEIEAVAGGKFSHVQLILSNLTPWGSVPSLACMLPKSNRCTCQQPSKGQIVVLACLARHGQLIFCHMWSEWNRTCLQHSSGGLLY